MTGARILRTAALGIVLLAIPARAPSYWKQSDPWPRGSIVGMQLQLGSPSWALSDGSTSWERVAEGALGTWNSHLSAFEFRVARDSTAPIGQLNGLNNVFWSSTVYGRSFDDYARPSQNNGIIGVSLYWQSNGVRTESDVVFNNTKLWDSYRGPYRTSSGVLVNDLYRTALHEFGHTLGLEHPNDFGQNVAALMNSTMGGQDSLTADDIAGAQSYYGPAGTAPGPSTPPSGTAPGAPTGFTATSSGSTVNLAWTGPSSGATPASYTIEAGSSSGLSNLASFATGNIANTYSTGGVANGSYYVRVRAGNSAGIGPASNEALLTVGGACSAPGAPSGLRLVSSTGGTVSLAWNASTGTLTTYVVEAGSAAGLSNLANSDLGSSTSFTATGVGRGTYYVRLRAKGVCGTSGVSNEIVLIV